MPILTDEGAAVVGQFSSLRTLRIHQPKITGTGLAEFANLKELQDLQLENHSQLSDADFASLAAMTGLRVLRLNGTGAGDQTAAILAKLRLRELSIGSPNLTDEGFARIGSMVTFTGWLIIGHEAKITDAGMAQSWAPKWLKALEIQVPGGITGKTFEPLSGLTNLNRVHIRSRDLTDEGLRYLGYLPKLQAVAFGNTRNDGARGVTDAGLMHLAEAPLLKELRFYREGTQVTDAGIEAFKARRPHVRVSFGW